MADRKCPKCLHVYRYPHMLKHHFETTYHCKKTTDEIKEFFIVNKVNKIEQTYECLICNKIYNNITTFNRHSKETVCGRRQTPQLVPQSATNFLDSLTPEQLKQIAKIINKKSIKTDISNNNLTNSNNSNNTINNITNNNNTIINNNSNNTINNTIIQHINPFGFEDVRTIPITEMKTILTSGTEAGLQIIKTIYNKIENKNFYKPNISRSEIACLNEDFKLTIYKSKEFCDALFDRCITFLHHMLYLCKNEYSKNNIKYIYDNIEHIETTMRTEIYDKKLQSIIETEFINNNINNKDRIKKFIKDIKDNTDIKDNSLLQLKNTSTLTEDKSKEYKISITNLELNNVFGDPRIILGLRKDEILLNVRISRFEESIFYNFWIDRIKNIKKYVMNNKKATIGDIVNLSKEENKIMSMLEIINKRVDNNRGDDYLDLNLDDEFRLDDITLEENDEEEDDIRNKFLEKT
jgi:hypothetical protein